MKEFSSANSHEQNVKISIDKILGCEIGIRKSSTSKKKRPDDTDHTEEEDDEDLFWFSEALGGLVFPPAFQDPFYAAECWMSLPRFNEEQRKLIHWFCYEKFNGIQVQQLYDEDDNMLPTSNPDELWETLKKFK